ncbi:MAG: hypothetical protein LBK58_08160 [Prevotellaceae bacterium]|jgi:hypothetical protein|nr:hypothetical protein [Prevotellaceae bacterium]
MTKSLITPAKIREKDCKTIDLQQKNKVKNIYMIENDGGLSFSVQKVKPSIVTSSGNQEFPEEILFLVEKVDAFTDLTVDGDLILSITKDEARSLVKVLQRLLN